MVGEVDQVVEPGEKLLPKHALDLSREGVYSIHCREQELLVGSPGRSERDFGDSTACDVDRSGDGVHLRLKGRRKTELACDGCLDLVALSAGIEEKP